LDSKASKETERDSTQRDNFIEDGFRFKDDEEEKNK